MIVIDTNIVAYLCIVGELNTQAIELLSLDKEWVAPPLWRSEFRNILTIYMKKKLISLESANSLFIRAENLFLGRELQPDTKAVLKLSQESGCTAYDCEFVALALQLYCPLITNDKEIKRAYPKHAFSLSEYIE